MSQRPTVLEGVLVAWNDQRGFGFLTPESGGPDVFIHISAFPPRATRPLVGERLAVESVTTASGKRQATRVISDRATSRIPWMRPRAPSRFGPIGYLAIPAFLALYVVLAAMSEIPVWIAVVYLTASVLAFAAYAIDKAAAVGRRWRISESVLLTIGLLGGWPGAIVAQQTFRHKTRKVRFQRAFWGTVALNVIAFVVFCSPLIGTWLAG